MFGSLKPNLHRYVKPISKRLPYSRIYLIRGTAFIFLLFFFLDWQVGGVTKRNQDFKWITVSFTGELYLEIFLSQRIFV